MLYCSPLKRALLTALAAYPRQKIIVDSRLREINTKEGMQKEELLKYVNKAAPQREAKVDTTKLPNEVWWDPEETEKAVHDRIQSFLKMVYKKTSRGKVCALVAHGGLFNAMTKRKPFPKIWCTPRGFPRNFKFFQKIGKPPQPISWASPISLRGAELAGPMP